MAIQASRGKLLLASAATLIVLLISLNAAGQEPTPGFNNKIPVSIMTPGQG